MDHDRRDRHEHPAADRTATDRSPDDDRRDDDRSPAGNRPGLTDPSNLYTVGTTDPALYRNILTVTLDALPPAATPEAPDTLMLGGLGLVLFGVTVGYVRRRRVASSA